MGKIEDLAGKRFGKLTVISLEGKDEKRGTLWKCQCDCGNIKIAKSHILKSGHIKSCGCSYKKNLKGKRFGRLTVISENGRDCIGNVLWLCKCDCGNEVTVKSSMLNNGHTKSCGCFAKEIVKEKRTIHGKSQTRIYGIWIDMKSRCYNENVKDFSRYGGRGITICPEWLGEHGFENFAKWSFENGYAENLSIDRKDNDKGYSPDNCRWVTQKEQQNNKRNNRKIMHNGETHTMSEWADIYGINPHTLRDRLEAGITGDELFDKKDRRFKKNSR